jgi:arginase
MRSDTGHARVISAPFHDGLKNVDRGEGPAALLDRARLTASEIVDTPNPKHPEAARVFAIAANLGERVRQTRESCQLPIVLAGDCNSCLGTVAGCDPDDAFGVVWLDAHADFDTTEDTAWGSLDGMGLRLLVGSGWDRLRSSVRGLTAIRESNVVLIGTRALEPGERRALERSAITVLRGRDWTSQTVEAALDRLRETCARVYLHVDMDVLDRSIGRANRYAEPGGLTAEQLMEVIRAVQDRFALAAVGMASYEPDADADGAVAAIGADVLRAVIAG